MTNGIKVTSHVTMKRPPRSPQELRRQASDLLQQRLREIWDSYRRRAQPDDQLRRDDE